MRSESFDYVDNRNLDGGVGLEEQWRPGRAELPEPETGTHVTHRWRAHGLFQRPWMLRTNWPSQRRTAPPARHQPVTSPRLSRAASRCLAHPPFLTSRSMETTTILRNRQRIAIFVHAATLLKRSLLSAVKASSSLDTHVLDSLQLLSTSLPA